MPEPTELSWIFHRAVTHITRYGHHQGALFAPDIDQFGRPRWASTPHELRPACMAGAISTVCTGQPDESNELSCAALRFASERMDGQAPLTDGVPDYIEHIAAWNDADGRTALDVIGRLQWLAMESELPVWEQVAA